MNQNLERLLNQVTPRALPTELRERVLAAVGEELNPTCPTVSAFPPARRRLRLRPGLAVAASLLISLVLNYAVNTTLDRRLLAVLGPRPVPRHAAEIAADIAALTDSQTGAWAFDRLASSRGQEDDAHLYPIRLKRMIDQLTADTQETPDEAPQENLQMDRDRHGSRDRNPSGAQRILRMDHWNTA
jgi:hypothetical protein